MKIARNILMVLGLSVFALLPISPLVNEVKAQTLLCDIFPFIENITLLNIDSVCTGSGPDREAVGTSLVEFFRLGVSFIFIGIVIVAVYVVIKAAVKYIRSEGDDTKIEEAQKAIKSAFIGIIALFVGIIGLILILVLFNATGALNNQDEIDAIEDPFI